MSFFALSLSLAGAAAAAATPTGAPAGVFDPPPMVRHQLEEGSSKRAAYEAFRQTLGTDPKNWASAEAPAVMDVTHYELDLHVDPNRQILSGSVTVDLTALEDGLDVVGLDMDLGLRALSVLRLGDDRYPYDTPVALVFDHAGDRLLVTLPRAIGEGERVKLQVTYGGHARRDGLIGSTGVNWNSNGGTPVIHTFAQPFGARVWWPCNDRPDDKATVSLRVTVPEGLDVAANGTERSTTDNGDGTSTSVWSSVYPVPTYLVVMHISDFVYSESTYTGLDGTTMPVGLWAMPAVAAQAESDLAVCVPQIEVMADRWGEYPFIDEKYGNATVFFGGGMEHQTLTTLSVYSVGDPWMQWLNVHELGHQWWGDWVTMDDWRDIWLNEGYATHTEWLWAEHLGPAVLADYLVDEDWRGWFSGPVYDNPEPFSWTIYAKGSWVAWMLRHVIGDEPFFDAMAAYRAEHAGGTATTEDLENAMEAASGTELDWFFDEWVYGKYRPRYVFDWTDTGSAAIELTVRQVQTNAGLFRMPMNIRVTTTAGVEDHRVWFEAEAEQTIEIQLQADATGVELNPDTHVLCEIAHASEPDLELGPDFPDGYDFGLVAGAGTATKALPVSNTGGADLVIQDIRPQSGSAFELQDPPDFPLTIPPGTTRTVEIIFDPIGYGRQTDQFSIQSNDPDRGNTILPVAGHGALFDDAHLAAPASTTVGRAPVGGTVESSFDALNLGGQPLAVQTAIDGDGFVLARTLPPVFAPGSSVEVRVRFQPTTVGPASGSLIFHTGDPTAPLKTVRLSGTGEAAPMLRLRPAVVALGVGDGSATATVFADNPGTEDLVLSVLEAEPPFIVVDPPAVPVVIPPGFTGSFVVGIETPASGTQSGHLTIHSNDPSIPVARVPLRAHISENAVDEASFVAAASGPGLGDTTWTSRAYLLNPTAEAVQTDLVFQTEDERPSDLPDAGFEIPARSQRVVPDLVAAAGATGSGGVNLRTSAGGLVAVSRTFATGDGGTYGQFIAAGNHDDALDGGGRYLLAGLSGNGGFHSNIGVLNLGDDPLAVDYRFFDSSGALIGTRTINADPHAFAQTVSVIRKLTGEIVRGGYATLAATQEDARFLAYGSVVDDASHDPTLGAPQRLGSTVAGVDLVVPAAAALPGAGGTSWRSQLDVVNTADEDRVVTVELVRANGSAVASMPMTVAAGATIHFDDVVGGLFGETGKGWLRISASGTGIHAASRTYNDDADGTYGQLIPAFPISEALGSGEIGVLAGLSSEAGFRTNLGLTSVSAADSTCALSLFDGAGATVHVRTVDLPAGEFVQLERVLADAGGFSGTAWATIECTGTGTAFFAHASVVDESTGDPTYVPAVENGNLR